MAVDASPDQPAPGLLVPSGAAVEPLTALAMNVHSSPGVYALLLGSGISIASGVPTGWGIVTDLVSKVATAQFPDDPAAAAEAAGDPEHWWNETFGEPLGYSSLLARAGQSAAARQALLDGYFIPAEGEESTDKAPTDAHRAIAHMIKRGAFRVVLTTNFDRLMERALEEVGPRPR
ncbi:hypothetical protein [Streptomyces sp. XY431]|uniref:hypothetical protein n=1 Tax=Streptomyces sp. XY431 TaxID=1415562 RepID=UPI0006AD9F65|nr:hypothetical protein [Streptomyces sp. XY431]